jgi:hypothetical protein
MILVYSTMVVTLAVGSWYYVRNLDRTYNDHPDYKGDDFLNEDEDETK